MHQEVRLMRPVGLGFFPHVLRRAVLTALKIAIDQIIEGVDVMEGFGAIRYVIHGNIGRAAIPLNHAGPVSKAHIDVGWHMQGVGHVGAIAP